MGAKVIKIARCTDCPFMAYFGSAAPTCIRLERYLTDDESKGIPKDCPLEDEKKEEPRWACGSFNEADF